MFSSPSDLSRRIDDPDLDVTEDDILVMQSAGPIGGPGMPEAGFMPLPRKILERGVRDMVRISDARMSGTAFGTVVLHVSPESAIGGPLALVRDGDMISLDANSGRLDLLVDDAELERRRAELQVRTYYQRTHRPRLHARLQPPRHASATRLRFRFRSGSNPCGDAC